MSSGGHKEEEEEEEEEKEEGRCCGMQTAVLNPCCRLCSRLRALLRLYLSISPKQEAVHYLPPELSFRLRERMSPR